MTIRSIDRFVWRGRTILKLATDDGLTGWGECGAVQPEDLERVRSVVIGQDPTRYEVIRTQISGPVGAAVNMALLDVVGHMANAPVYQVLGGPTRSRIRAMTSWSDRALNAGYRAFVSTSLEVPVRDGLDFVVDGGGRLTPGQAASLAAKLEQALPLWLDEPCPRLSLGAARKIADESVIPLGWGRHASSIAEIQDLLREQAIDVIRLDIAQHGLSTIRKAAALAETYYVAVAPYHDGGPVATAAALHLAASLPNFVIQQIPWAEGDDAKIRAEIVHADLETPKDGFLTLPTGPGLGIHVNEQALRRYAA